MEGFSKSLFDWIGKRRNLLPNVDNSVMMSMSNGLFKDKTLGPHRTAKSKGRKEDSSSAKSSEN